MASRFTEEIDGEGVAWAAAGFVASLLIGVVIEPFRGTVGSRTSRSATSWWSWSPPPSVAGRPG